jgi:hypothetical protein
MSLMLTPISLCIFLFSSVPCSAEMVSKLPLCKEIIARQETKKHIPRDLLKAIAIVESGISPWIVNAHGGAHNFSTKNEAVKYIRKLVDDGVKNIGVGCMQLHYFSHHHSFGSVEQMLEPEKNIAYAATLLKKLEGRYGSMDKAVKMYHSASPFYHNPYKNRVYGTWAKIRRPVDKGQKDNSGKRVHLHKTSLSKTLPKKPVENFARFSRKIVFGIGTPFSKKS